MKVKNFFRNMFMGRCNCVIRVEIKFYVSFVFLVVFLGCLSFKDVRVVFKFFFRLWCFVKYLGLFSFFLLFFLVF